MKKILIALTMLSTGTVMAQNVPSDIRRTEIEVEKGEIDMNRANLSVNAGIGQSNSSFRPDTYGIKNVELRGGTKFIIGTVDNTGAMGFAIAPDLTVSFRLDQDNKKVRLEAGGKVISIFDTQMVLAPGLLPQAEVEVAKKRLAELKKINIPQSQFDEQNDVKEKIQQEIKQLEQKLGNHELALTKTFATIDLSTLNLGIKYKDVSEALYKFFGASGSVLTLSTHVSGRSGKVNFGLCGIVDLLSLNAGKIKNSNGDESNFSYGTSGSVCAHFGIGPVKFTNTFGAGVDRIKDNNNYFINNTARLGVTTKAIPGVIAEAGAFHTYSKEWFADREIESNIVGAGVTVMAK